MPFLTTAQWSVANAAAMKNQSLLPK